MNTQIAELFIDIPEGFLFAKVWSPENCIPDEPIILLYDSSTSIETWHDFLEGLMTKTNRAVVVFDRLGSGYFTEEEMETYFPKIVEALSLKKFFIFDSRVEGPASDLCSIDFPGQCLGVLKKIG